MNKRIAIIRLIQPLLKWKWRFGRKVYDEKNNRDNDGGGTPGNDRMRDGDTND